MLRSSVIIFCAITLIFPVVLGANSELAQNVNKTCESYNITASPLDLKYFVGKWYKIAALGGNGSCGYFNILTQNQNETVFLNLTYVVGNSNYTSVAIPQQENFTNIFKNNSVAVVLGSDYRKFAVLWFCKDTSNATSRQEVLVLSRTNSSKLSDLRDANSTLSKSKILEGGLRLKEIDHVKCNYTNTTHATPSKGTNTGHSTLYLCSSFMLSILLVKIFSFAT